MKFMFDLRPAQYRQVSKKKKIDLSKVLFIFLLTIFCVAGVGSLGFQYFRLRELVIKEEALNQSIALLQMQSTKLGAEMERLKIEEKRYLQLLTLVKEDLPSLEFIAAVEGSLPGTVWVQMIGMSSGLAKLEGKAYSEADVVVFSNALAQATVVKDVMIPKVKKVDGTNPGLAKARTIDFNMNCILRDIAAMDSSANMTEKSE